MKGEELRDSDTGEKAFGGGWTLSESYESKGRYLEADKYPFVEAVFGFEVERGGRGRRR